MKIVARFVLLSVITVQSLVAQLSTSSTKDTSGSFCKRVEDESQYISISAGVAEKLLIEKVEPIYKHLPLEGRVSGTVVIRFELGKHGEVLCPKLISGPKLLQQPVLEAVRQYKYKPYLLGGEPIVVSTLLSVPASNY